MRYLPKSDRERREMLAAVGVSSIDDLFECIPEQVRLKRPLDLPRALSEPEIIARFRQWAGQNAEGHLRLLGAGVYDHFRSVVVDSLISRGEFFTAYTPYQAEISQGTLQAIFEFQTLMCQLTGQEVANASMYDGSTALAESVLMALRITRRQRVLVSSAVHPEYRQVLRTYLQGQQIDLDELPMRADGRLDLDAAAKALDDQTAVLALQSPNFFGCLEEIPAVAELCRSPAPRSAPELWRPLRRRHCLPAEVRAQPARPPRRPGHLQHLHQPGALRACRHHLSQHLRQGRTPRAGPTESRQGPLPR
jgi:glycine dehydrogenase subunit 1